MCKCFCQHVHTIEYKCNDRWHSSYKEDSILEIFIEKECIDIKQPTDSPLTTVRMILSIVYLLIMLKYLHVIFEFLCDPDYKYLLIYIYLNV